MSTSSSVPAASGGAASGGTASDAASGTPPAPDARTARERIVDAAHAEFAAHGFAGARVDRLAAAAGINKERLYAYYGGKRGLFVEAIAVSIGRVDDFARSRATSLPDLAARLYDFLDAHPDDLRLFTWARLEDPSVWEEAVGRLGPLHDPSAAIAAWQREGTVDPRWDAGDLFVTVLGLCEIWHVTPFVRSEPGAAARRRALVVSVAELVAGPPPA